MSTTDDPEVNGTPEATDVPETSEEAVQAESPDVTTGDAGGEAAAGGNGEATAADAEADTGARGEAGDGAAAGGNGEAAAGGDGEAGAGTAASGPTTLAAQRAAREAARAARQQDSGLLRSVKRYGPFVAIAIVLAGAVAVFSGADDGGDEPDAADGGSLDEEGLIRSGPMTPAKAELEGVDVDFGPNCDLDTGRIKLPTLYAPPCVEPFEGDNGGATSPGVTEDEILVVRYEPDPTVDPVGSALVRATGLETNPDTSFETASDYVDAFNATFETYGRKVKMVRYLGTGASDDEATAKADAIKIAEMKPFAVINGPLQSATTFGAELARRGVVCMSPCATSIPNGVAEDYQPHLWQNGPTPDEAAAMAGELIAKLAPPGPAELAGDPALQEKDRVYALVHFNTEDGAHTAVAKAMTEELRRNGVKVDEDIEYILDPTSIQEDARTLVAKLENAGVTSVIFYGDPLMPKSLTEEATRQDYRPEWILGPNLLADAAVFARSFDQSQWPNGFGIGLNPLRGAIETDDAWRVYQWAYGTEPPNDNFAAIYPGIRQFFSAVQLAGPDLRPETFRDGMFRFPVSGGYPSRTQISWGRHGVWDDLDYGGTDDAAVIWWDPEAVGDDESGEHGEGLYRYANGGERYTIGNFPDDAEEAGLFDEANSLTIVDELPPEAILDYPPPDLGG